jgi:hypothetical protein
VGIYFKLAPGVRVRVTTRGVRASLGPRAARVHVGGGYRPGLSTGAGPVTLYHSVGRTRHSQPHPARRSSASIPSAAGSRRSTVGQAAPARAAETAGAVDSVRAIESLHRHSPPPVQPPVAPPVPVVDEAAIRGKHLAGAFEGIGFWKRSARQAARAAAAAAAEAEIQYDRQWYETQRQQWQADLDERWAELQANQPDVVLATLAEAFEAHQIDAAAVSVDEGQVSVVVFVPGPEVVPEKLPTETPAGRPTVRAATKTQAAALYTTLVCGHVLAVVREALAVAAGLTAVRAAAVRSSAADVYGHSSFECLAAATFARSALQGVDWPRAGSVEVFGQCGTDSSLHTTGRVSQLEPIDLTSEPDLAALLAAIDGPSGGAEGDDAHAGPPGEGPGGAGRLG